MTLGPTKAGGLRVFVLFFFVWGGGLGVVMSGDPEDQISCAMCDNFDYHGSNLQ